MSSPKIKTIKRLFAKSGNQCAFPSCPNRIIDNNTGKVLGEICHIKAQKPDGPRFDKNQTEEDRHDYDNLILLCSLHHTVVDSDLESYTIDSLLTMKTKHELNFDSKEEVIEEALVNQLIQNINISNTIVFESNQIKQIGQQWNQYAQTIQNFNSPSRLKESISYDELLSRIYDESIQLSQILADTIKIANTNKDKLLIDLCRNELSGWTGDVDVLPIYRKIEVYISPLQIESVNNMSNDELWRDLESRTNFVKKGMFFPNAVPLIEKSIEEGKYHDPYNSYFHFTQRQGDLFPQMPHPDTTVYIYAKGTLYLGLLKSVRNNLANEILERLK